jgi:hypothetical protein
MDRAVLTWGATRSAYEDQLGFLHLVHSDMSAVLDLGTMEERPVVVFGDRDRCSLKSSHVST